MYRQSGIMMIEVMLSVLLISIGILGVASLQTYSLRSNQSSYWRSVAADLANDMAERIRANRSPKIVLRDGTSAVVDENNKTVVLPPDYGKLKCTIATDTAKTISCAWVSGYTPPTTAGGDIAKADLAAWMTLARASLPMGSTGGAIVCRASSDDSPTGTSPVLDPSDSNFATKTGCLSPSAGTYSAAPYVIKVWWQDIRPARGESTASDTSATLLLYSTTI
ncbi:type IV pilus modification protein PilV [Chitinimonas koreensis]|uniref:type IV pilus modification protein PilV n=1 Tax=Chitinimonas koreensis TaxID=356302 RepID=UPI000407A06B|nr:type IV pilus modification protein PilV [Chitinimonas koreensis]QNM96344.1 type IV pilus modification protein PilV [Chitinimonas koreensis]